MPLPDGSMTATPLAPSVEKAYYRKCIELKRRLNDVEAANDEAKIKRQRLDRGIMKMRLERAFLLDELRKRMDVNVDNSDGSDAETGTKRPPSNRPLLDKRRRTENAQPTPVSSYEQPHAQASNTHVATTASTPQAEFIHAPYQPVQYPPPATQPDNQHAFLPSQPAHQPSPHAHHANHQVHQPAPGAHSPRALVPRNEAPLPSYVPPRHEAVPIPRNTEPIRTPRSDPIQPRSEAPARTPQPRYEVPATLQSPASHLPSQPESSMPPLVPGPDGTRVPANARDQSGRYIWVPPQELAALEERAPYPNPPPQQMPPMRTSGAPVGLPGATAERHVNGNGSIADRADEREYEGSRTAALSTENARRESVQQDAGPSGFAPANQ